MGFNLTSDVPRREVLKALESFAFHELHCVHKEFVQVLNIRCPSQELAGLIAPNRNRRAGENVVPRR
jgi:hypothetical protein